MGMSSMSSEGAMTGKRLDFEDITTPRPQFAGVKAFHSQLQSILSELESLRFVPDTLNNLLQDVTNSAKELHNTSISKIEDACADLELEYIRAKAENDFLNYIVDEHAEGCSSKLQSLDGIETLKQKHFGLQNFLGNRHMIKLVGQQVESINDEFDQINLEAAGAAEQNKDLLEALISEVKDFEERFMLAQQHIDICHERIKGMEISEHVETQPNIERELSLLKAEEEELLRLDCDSSVYEIQRKTLDTNEQVLELEKQTQLVSKELAELQEMAKTRDRADSLLKLMEFLDGVKVLSYTEGMVNLSLKACSLSDNGITLTKDYRLSVAVDPKGFLVTDAKLDPNDVPIDDIVRYSKERSALSSLWPSHLEFLIRKTQQRISSQFAAS